MQQPCSEAAHLLALRLVARSKWYWAACALAFETFWLPFKVASKLLFVCRAKISGGSRHPAPCLKTQ